MSTLTIELDSLTADRLQERSRQEGRRKEELAAGLLARSLAADIRLSVPMQEVIPAHTEAEAKRLASIAKLQQWNAEDATGDLEEIARREARWQVIEQNIETNRVSFPVPED